MDAHNGEDRAEEGEHRKPGSPVWTMGSHTRLGVRAEEVTEQIKALVAKLMT